MDKRIKIKRTWRERLLTLPWDPLKKYRYKYVSESEYAAIKILSHADAAMVLSRVCESKKIQRNNGDTITFRRIKPLDDENI